MIKRVGINFVIASCDFCFTHDLFVACHVAGRNKNNVAFFKRGVEDIGFFTMGSVTPIIPLFIGSESLAFRVCKQALDQGVFTTPVVYPAVPLGQALIRTSIMPSHQQQHLEQALDVFDQIARQLPIPKGIREDSLPHAHEMDFSYL